MQDLGLDTRPPRRPTDLEAELPREQATAPGLAGVRKNVFAAAGDDAPAAQLDTPDGDRRGVVRNPCENTRQVATRAAARPIA